MKILIKNKLTNIAMWLFAFIVVYINGITPLRAESRWYKIELIVFEQQSPSHEKFRHKGASVDWPRDVKSLSADGGRAYSTLSSAESSLKGLYGRLQRSGRYTPLLHLAWIQPVAKNRSGKAVRISRNGVNGYVRLQRGDYLHLIIDVNYNSGRYDNSIPGFDNEADSPSGNSSKLLYHLKERRRILLKEIHYFDHPKFGSVIRVAPLSGN